MKLGIDRCPYCRPRVIGYGRYKDICKESAFLPLRIPVAIQAASTCDHQRFFLLQVRFCEPIKAIEDCIAVDACKVAELRIASAHVEMRCVLKVLVSAQFLERAVQQKIEQFP